MASEALQTVGQVASEFGVTVRALHHYDSLGLVVPSERSYAGYRLYTSKDVARLAQVVLLRRLEMPLDDIREALDGDVTDHLRKQRDAVIARRNELDSLVRSIDTLLEAEMSESTNPPKVSTEELKEIFGDNWDESYADEAQERWGHTDAWAESQRRTKNYTKDDWAAIKAESDAVMTGFADAKRAGAQPGSAQADAAVVAHREHIEKWFNPVPLPMLHGMGQMFSADPRFAKTYDDIEPGLAAYVTDAIVAYCDGTSA